MDQIVVSVSSTWYPISRIFRTQLFLDLMASHPAWHKTDFRPLLSRRFFLLFFLPGVPPHSYQAKKLIHPQNEKKLFFL